MALVAPNLAVSQTQGSPEYRLVNLRALFQTDPAEAELALDGGFAIYCAAFPDPAERESRESLRNSLLDPDGVFTIVLAYGENGMIGGRTMSLLNIDTPAGEGFTFAVGGYLFIADGQKRRGIGSRIVETTNAMMARLGAGLILSEQNDPYLMTAAEIERDKLSGISPQARLQFWKKQGYFAFDAPYAQPSMEGGGAVWYLRLCGCLGDAARIPASAGFDGRGIHGAVFGRMMRAYFDRFVAMPDRDPTCRQMATLLAGRDRVDVIDIEHPRRFHQGRPDLTPPRLRLVRASVLTAARFQP